MIESQKIYWSIVQIVWALTKEEIEIENLTVLYKFEVTDVYLMIKIDRWTSFVVFNKSKGFFMYISIWAITFAIRNTLIHVRPVIRQFRVLTKLRPFVGILPFVHVNGGANALRWFFNIHWMKIIFIIIRDLKKYLKWYISWKIPEIAL